MSLSTKIGIVVITLLSIAFVSFQFKDVPFYVTRQASTPDEEQEIKTVGSPEHAPNLKKLNKIEPKPSIGQGTRDRIFKKIARVTVSVKSGDTLMTVLSGAGVSKEQAAQLIFHLRKVYDVRKLPIGQIIHISLSKDQLTKVSFSPSFDFEIVASLQKNKSFKVENKRIQLAIEDKIVLSLIHI